MHVSLLSPPRNRSPLPPEWHRGVGQKYEAREIMMKPGKWLSGLLSHLSIFQDCKQILENWIPPTPRIFKDFKKKTSVFLQPKGQEQPNSLAVWT